jgi:hypothetical protein
LPKTRQSPRRLPRECAAEALDAEMQIRSFSAM